MLLALLTQPSTLVAMDLEPTPVDLLDRFIETRGLEASVKPHYGIDQGDRAALARVVEGELGDQLIDLVIDDASHVYEPTLTSLNYLLPRLRPGGLYLIEDWTRYEQLAVAVGRALQDPESEHYEEVMTAAFSPDDRPRDLPLSRLAAELVLVRAEGDQVIDRVTVDSNWIIARRGPGPLDPATFRLHDVLADHYGTLSPR